LARRWFYTITWSWMAAVVRCLSAMFSPRPKDRPVAALLIPLFDRKSRSSHADGALRDLELSSAALWRPTPALFTSIVLPVFTVLAASAVLLAAPIFVKPAIAPGNLQRVFVVDVDVRSTEPSFARITLTYAWFGISETFPTCHQGSI